MLTSSAAPLPSGDHVRPARTSTASPSPSPTLRTTPSPSCASPFTTCATSIGTCVTRVSRQPPIRGLQGGIGRVSGRERPPFPSLMRRVWECLPAIGRQAPQPEADQPGHRRPVVPTPSRANDVQPGHRRSTGCRCRTVAPRCSRGMLTSSAALLPSGHHVRPARTSTASPSPSPTLRTTSSPSCASPFTTCATSIGTCVTRASRPPPIPHLQEGWGGVRGGEALFPSPGRRRWKLLPAIGRQAPQPEDDHPGHRRPVVPTTPNRANDVQPGHHRSPVRPKTPNRDTGVQPDVGVEQ
jgi:hypothetical protein